MICIDRPTNILSFSEGAIASGITQKLRNLIDSIKNAIYRFFKMVFPFLFSSKEKPANHIQVQVQGLHKVPSRLDLTDEKKAEEDEEEIPDLLADVQVSPLGPQGISDWHPIDPMPDEDDEKRPDDLTQGVRRLWNAGTIERNRLLDQIDPPVKSPRLDLLPKLGIPRMHKDQVVQGSKIHDRQQRGAISVMMEAIPKLFAKIENEQEIDPALLDEALTRGNAMAPDLEKDFGGKGIPFKLAVNDMEGFVAAPLKGRGEEIRSGDIQKLIHLLKGVSRNVPLSASLLFEGDMEKNPNIYGVFIQFNRETRNYVYCVLDLVGKSEKDPVSWRTFNKLGDFVGYFPAGNYAVLPIAKKEE